PLGRARNRDRGREDRFVGHRSWANPRFTHNAEFGAGTHRGKGEFFRGTRSLRIFFRRRRELRRSLPPRLFAPLVDGALFVEAGDQFSNPRFREPLRPDGVKLLELGQSVFEGANLLLSLLVFCRVRDHSSISTTPLYRPSASRVRLKKATQAS